MPLELSLPFLALSGAALTAIAYKFWPRIAVRTHSEKLRGIGVREIALSISQPRLGRALAADAAPKNYEFVIYMTMKSCNR
jgi:hypothetical protein